MSRARRGLWLIAAAAVSLAGCARGRGELARPAPVELEWPDAAPWQGGDAAPPTGDGVASPSGLR